MPINDPTDIADLEVWLDGQTGVTLSGSDVTQWDDQSGNARHATQATSSARPTYVQNLNGTQHGIVFAGTSEYMDLDLSFLAGSDYTAFFWGSRTTDTAGGAKYPIAVRNVPSAGSNTNRRLYFGWQDANVFTLDQHNNGLDYAAGLYGGSPLYEAWFGWFDNAVGHKIYRNAVEVASNGNTTAMLAANGGSLGRSGLDEYAHCHLLQVCVFSRALTPTEVTDLYDWAVAWSDESEGGEDLPEDSDLNPPFIEVTGEGDTFFTVYFTSERPSGVTGLRVRYTVDGDPTVTLDPVEIDLADSNESWRYQLVTDLDLGVFGYAEAQWISDDGASAWSDPVPFALSSEAAEEDSELSSGEEPAEVTGFTQSPELEAPWPSYRAEVLLYEPTFPYTNLIRRNTSISGPGISGSRRVDFYPHGGERTVDYDWLRPNSTYTLTEWSIYTLAGSLRSSPQRTITIETPPALAPPRITSPAKRERTSGGSEYLIEWEEEATGTLYPGTDRIELTYGDGAYEVLGEVESDGSSPVPYQLPVDWASYADGPAWVSVRRITPSDGTSVRRLAGPFLIDNAGYGGELGADVNAYDIGGTANESSRWTNETDPDTSEAVMQRAGPVGAGTLSVPSLAIGDAIDVIVVGKNASSDGTGNWFQYVPDQNAAIGAAAYVDAENRFLAARLGGWIAPTGTVSGQLVGTGKFSQWDDGSRLGRGLGQFQIVFHDGDPQSHSIRSTPSRYQWVRNYRYGDSRYAVMIRVQRVGDLLDGSKRYRIRSYYLGLDHEGEDAALAVNDLTQDTAELSGAPAISVISNHASAVQWVYGLTFYGAQVTADDDLGTQPLPGWRVAGEHLISLDPTYGYWYGTPGVIKATDEDHFFLDYAWLPVLDASLELTGAYIDRRISQTIADGADQPVRTANVILHMSTADGSISSGAVESPYNLLSGTFRACVFGKRLHIIQDWIGEGPNLGPTSEGYWDPNNWRARFWGRIEEHPATHSGDIQIFSRDYAEGLMVPYTGPDVWIGDEGTLVPLHEAIQRILDAVFGTGVWALLADESLEWAVPAFLMGQVPDVLATIREAAQQRGGVVRWWFDEDTQRFQLTLFILQVDKSSPDWTYGPDETHDIPGHGSDVTNLRNDFRLQYRDADGALFEVRSAATEEEILAYGVRPLLIEEGSTSLVQTQEDAETMLESVTTALRTPATIGRRRLPRNFYIEVNSLIEFEADARIAQENVLLYVTDWVEERSMQGEQYNAHITTGLRGAPVGQLGAWLKSFAANSSIITGGPLGKGPPLFEFATTSSETIGTLWFRIIQRGIGVQSVLAQTKLPAPETWSDLGDPTRGPGEQSVVKGRTLAIGEYEQDVYLINQDVSFIRAECTLEGGIPMTIAIVAIDADEYPTILSITVSGSTVTVVCDDDTLSIRAEIIAGDGSFFDEQDGSSAVFDIPLGVGESATVRITAYNKLTADRGESGELSTFRDVTVPDGEAGGTVIEFFSIAAPPSDGDDTMTFSVRASQSISGERLRFFRRYEVFYPKNPGEMTSWFQITSQVTPDPTGELPPESLTEYTWPSGFVRDDAGQGIVYMEILARITDASGTVTEAPVEQVSWSIA